MKRQKILFATFVLIGSLFFSCSTKKNNALSRNWHALNTRYNTLYHGNIAFEQARAALNSGYQDDYWEVLPVERLEVTEEIKLDSEGNTPGFLLAEEKATKAIQKHSMDIKDRERNPQIDEAFLLLGKARYFDQRYIPALEAFNYVLKKYTKGDKLNEVTIWREKTNMRLDNPKLAIKNLKRLLRVETFQDQEYADAHAVLAQCYVHLNVPDTAIQKLKIAQAYTRRNTEKGRYGFIIGQLYDQLGHKDSANAAYDKVIALKHKTPWVYSIHAHIQKIRNTPFTEANTEMLWEYLTALEKNWENRYFLDKIYREMARLHQSNKADSAALVYYNKSLRATRSDRKLNALNYQSLADYYFGKSDYKTAGRYYDSTLTNLVENTKTYRSIKKKLDNLADVIQYEGLVQRADSILVLYQMPKAERRAYFEDYIAALKRKDEAAAKAAQEQAASRAASSPKTTKANVKKRQAGFYFYNATRLEYGKKDFETRWGHRKLEDDWRWSNTSIIAPAEVAESTAAAANPLSPQNLRYDQKYSPDFYLGQIPATSSEMDSIKAEKTFANYQLGIIYKEKFKENQLAATKLQSVLAAHPEERLLLPTKYNLYKIYEETRSPLAPDLKEDLLTNHPNTRYAKILANPQAVLEEDTTRPDAAYTALYKLYEQQQFQEVLTQSETYSSTFAGDPVVPKFELLRAQAIGRLHGLEAFTKALNYVALTYPNEPEGKKAAQWLAEQLPQWENQEFSTETGASGTGNWKVVFTFAIENQGKGQRLKERLEEIIEELDYKNNVSRDVYNTTTEFVVVHGFPSRDFALGFAELLRNNKDYRITDENFVVLSSNYAIIQIHKNLEAYTAQFLTPKP